ncbi:esterase/lipase family protein [Kitasatospora sp. NPDC056184]|uniref:esterase/lipase family protein n=1 Tax=Kitasatospora sp. NPDC056184 TaxID=3345738 RepID=UPI0035E14A5A
MRQQPIEDLVVVVPGITGSRLAVDGKEVWGPSPGALVRGIASFLGSVKALRLPADLGDDHPGDGVVPTGLVPSLHAVPGVRPVVDGYSDLVGWLERGFTLRRALPTGRPDRPGVPEVPVNLVEFAYDWRLSCRYNARLLATRVDEALGRWRATAPQRAGAKVRLICHSMGGLVARYWVERLGGAEVTRQLITLGTPHRGSIGALESLVNGHRIGLGPVAADLTAFSRSLPSLHQLTPDYACVETPDGLRHPRELATALDGVDPRLLADAGCFHAEIRQAALRRVRQGGAERLCLPVVGVRQPTPTTAAVTGDGRLRLIETIGGVDEGGDGRVPRFAAYPAEIALDDPVVRASFANHGAIKGHAGVREDLYGWLSPTPAVYRGALPAHPLGVRVAEYGAAGEPLRVEAAAGAEGEGADTLAVRATVRDEHGGTVASRTLRNAGGGRYEGAFAGLGPGAYAVSVHATLDNADTAVTALTLVLEGDA